MLSTWGSRQSVILSAFVIVVMLRCNISIVLSIPDHVTIFYEKISLISELENITIELRTSSLFGSQSKIATANRKGQLSRAILPWQEAHLITMDFNINDNECGCTMVSPLPNLSEIKARYYLCNSCPQNPGGKPVLCMWECAGMCTVDP